MEKHESMGEELGHCVQMRKSDERGKRFREQRVQRAQGKVSHHIKEEGETDEPRLGGKRVWVGQSEQGVEMGEAPRKLQDYHVNERCAEMVTALRGSPKGRKQLCLMQ